VSENAEQDSINGDHDHAPGAFVSVRKSEHDAGGDDADDGAAAAQGGELALQISAKDDFLDEAGNTAERDEERKLGPGGRCERKQSFFGRVRLRLAGESERERKTRENGDRDDPVAGGDRQVEQEILRRLPASGDQPANAFAAAANSQPDPAEQHQLVGDCESVSANAAVARDAGADRRTAGERHRNGDENQDGGVQRRRQRAPGRLNGGSGGCGGSGDDVFVHRGWRRIVRPRRPSYNERSRRAEGAVMDETVIISAVRTPIGKFQGALGEVPAPELGAMVVREAVKRAGVEPKQVDECIMGLVVAAGLGQNPARQAALRGGLLPEAGAMTINKVCGSGLKAVALAAQAIQTGNSDIVVAGGMESMSNAPYLLPQARKGYRLGNAQIVDAVVNDGLWDVYNNYHMGMTAENVAEKYGITRAEQDEFAVSSHRKAVAAQKECRFKSQILPVELPAKKKG